MFFLLAVSAAAGGADSVYPYRIAALDSTSEERRAIHAFNKCVGVVCVSPCVRMSTVPACSLPGSPSRWACAGCVRRVVVAPHQARVCNSHFCPTHTHPTHPTHSPHPIHPTPTPCREQKRKCRELQVEFTHPGRPGASFKHVVDEMRAALTAASIPPTPLGPGGRPWFPHGVRLLSPAYFEVLRWMARCGPCVLCGFAVCVALHAAWWV